AEFPQCVGKAQHQRSDQARPRERKNHPQKRANAARAKNRGSVEQPPVQRFERRNQRLYREGQAGNEGRQHQPGEREGEPVSEQRLPDLPDGAARAERDERIEAEHRRRKNQRQSDNLFEKEFSAPTRERQPVSQRHRNDKKKDRNGSRKAQREEERV